MNPKLYQFRLQGVRGLPGLLLVVGAVLLLLAIIAAIVVIGVAVAAIALPAAILSALYFGGRRGLLQKAWSAASRKQNDGSRNASGQSAGNLPHFDTAHTAPGEARSEELQIDEILPPDRR